MSRELLERVVAREALQEHDGRSGATLERLTLDDGTTLILKRADPSIELGAMLGFADAELALWQSGTFDRFPSEVRHPILDKWEEGDRTVTLMRDLGDTIPGWSRKLSAVECNRIFAAASAMHRTFAGEALAGVVPFEGRLGLMSPRTMQSMRDEVGLAGHIAHGWERFHDLVDADVSQAVDAVHADPSLLATAFGDTPWTLLHADLWPVNLAIDETDVTFIDWSFATVGPAAFECSVFLSGAADHVQASRDEMIAAFRQASGSLTDDRAMRVAILASLCDLGWNKALDAAVHEDADQRARATADLEWWVQAGRASIADLK